MLCDTRTSHRDGWEIKRLPTVCESLPWHDRLGCFLVRFLNGPNIRGWRWPRFRGHRRSGFVFLSWITACLCLHLLQCLNHGPETIRTASLILIPAFLHQSNQSFGRPRLWNIRSSAFRYGTGNLSCIHILERVMAGYDLVAHNAETGEESRMGYAVL